MLKSINQPDYGQRLQQTPVVAVAFTDPGQTLPLRYRQDSWDQRLTPFESGGNRPHQPVVAEIERLAGDPDVVEISYPDVGTPDEELRIVQGRFEAILQTGDLTDSRRPHIAVSPDNIRIIWRNRQIMQNNPANPVHGAPS